MTVLIAPSTTPGEEASATFTNTSGVPCTLSIFPAAGGRVDTLCVVDLYRLTGAGDDPTYIGFVGGPDFELHSRIFDGGGKFRAVRRAHPNGLAFGFEKA